MCDSCSWIETIEEIAGLINDDNHRFAFAYDTLSGIRETIERTHHVTEKQRIAIANIGRKRP